MQENTASYTNMQPEAASYSVPASESASVAFQTSSEPRNEQESVTTLDQLKAYSRGRLVRLPDFAEGQPFVARVVRPSLLALAKMGRIPNSLLTSAGELFNGGTQMMDEDNENMLRDIYDICRIIADAALVEPKLKDIEEAGMQLTDEQLMALMSYSQNGVKALESFR